MITGSDGTMYGTTRSGGTYAKGSIFSFTPNGVFTTLYSFSGPDGSDPETGLTFGPNGQLYGTAATGGSAGLGTLFVLTGTTLQTIHTFTGSPDGSTPHTALLWRNGYLYGATKMGGGASSGYYTENGIVFKILPGGDYQIVYTFPQYASPSNPQGDMTLMGQDLYGCCASGIGEDWGGFFELDGSDNFVRSWAAGHHSGLEAPNGGLVCVGGTLYGSSASGSTHSAPPGSAFAFPYTLLHVYDVGMGWLSGEEPPYIYPHFASTNSLVGGVPLAPLTDVKNGDLLGSNSQTYTNDWPISSGEGTLFRVDLNLTSDFTHQAFCFNDFFNFGGIYGSRPAAAMVQGSDGNFYGTTSQGGANGGGTIYRVLQNRRPNAPDYQVSMPPLSQPVALDFLAVASDPDGDPLTFVALMPVNTGWTYLPVITSSDGIVTVPYSSYPEGYWPIGDTYLLNYIYVVSDGMDVATGNVTFTAPPIGQTSNSYTGTLMSDGTAIGTVQTTANFTKSSINPSNQSVSLTGVLDINGTRNAFIAGSANLAPATLYGPTLNAKAGAFHITLTDEYDLQWLATITGSNSTYSALLRPLTATGIVHQYYTATLSDTGTNQGTGFAFLVLDNVRLVRMSGRLPDGTPFTASAGVGDGQGTITASIQPASGFTATIQIDSMKSSTVTGSIQWQIGGKSSTAVLTANPYTPPNPQQSALNLSHGRNCKLVFTRPNGTTLSVNASLTSPNGSVSTGNSPEAFEINPQTGYLTGAFFDPIRKLWSPFFGSVMQQANGASGYFQQGRAFGQFTLTLQP